MFADLSADNVNASDSYILNEQVGKVEYCENILNAQYYETNFEFIFLSKVL